MGKGTSFAAKAKGKKKSTQSFVKYVKSVKSEKTGHWRFNEQMVAVNESENLDDALKRLEEESMALDMELPVMEELVVDETPSEVDASASENPADESVEETADEKPEVASKDNNIEEAPAAEAETKNADEDAAEEKAEESEDGSSEESDTEESIEKTVEEKTEA